MPYHLKEEDHKKVVIIIPIYQSVLKDYDIDVKTGIKNSEGVDAYLSLLKVFYESMNEVSEELERFYSEDDLKEYTIRIHSLKSSARIIGADDLGDEAQRLEDAGKKEDRIYIRDHHDSFMKKYRQLEEPLSFIAGGIEKKDVRDEADLSLIESTYKEIKKAAEAMDINELDEIFRRMDSYVIPKSEADKWDQIRSAYDRFDYSDILSALNL